MNCRNIQKSLVADAQDEVDPATSRVIGEHIIQCRTCQRKKEEIIHHLRLYRHLPAYPPNTNNWPGLLSRIQQSSERKTRVPLYPAFYGVGALLVLCFFFALIYLFTNKTHWDLQIVQGNLHFSPVPPESFPNLPISLKKGSKLKTGSGETAKCYFQKNNMVAFGGNTLVELDTMPRLILHKGEIFVRSREGGQLVIQTGHGEIYMKSTAFSVTRLSHSTRLKVYKGSVHFRSKHGNVIAREGHMLTTNADTRPTILRNDMKQEYPWWTEAPVFLALRIAWQNKSPHQLHLNLLLKNKSKTPITLHPFSQIVPRFSLHIKNKEKSYTIPLRSVVISPGDSPVEIPAAGNYIWQCDLSPEIDSIGRYYFTAIYSGKLDKWKGVVASPPLRVEIK